MSASQGGVSYKKDPGDLCFGEGQLLARGEGAVMGLGGWCIVTTRSCTKGSLSILLPSNSWRADHPSLGLSRKPVTGGAGPEGRTGNQGCDV